MLGRDVQGSIGAGGGVVLTVPQQGQTVGHIGAGHSHEGIRGAEHGDGSLIAARQQLQHGHVVEHGAVEAVGVAVGAGSQALREVVRGALEVIAVEGNQVGGGQQALGLHGEGIVVAVGVGLSGQVQRGRHQAEHTPHSARAVLGMGASGGEGRQEIQLAVGGAGPEAVALGHLENIRRVHKIVRLLVDLADHERVGDHSNLRSKERREFIKR